jgi:hypothetical protein
VVRTDEHGDGLHGLLLLLVVVQVQLHHNFLRVSRTGKRQHSHGRLHHKLLVHLRIQDGRRAALTAPWTCRRAGATVTEDQNELGGDAKRPASQTVLMMIRNSREGLRPPLIKYQQQQRSWSSPFQPGPTVVLCSVRCGYRRHTVLRLAGTMDASDAIDPPLDFENLSIDASKSFLLTGLHFTAQFLFESSAASRARAHACMKKAGFSSSDESADLERKTKRTRDWQSVCQQRTAGVRGLSCWAGAIFPRERRGSTRAPVTN